MERGKCPIFENSDDGGNGRRLRHPRKLKRLTPPDAGTRLGGGNGGPPLVTPGSPPPPLKGRGGPRGWGGAHPPLGGGGDPRGGGGLWPLVQYGALLSRIASETELARLSAQDLYEIAGRIRQRYRRGELDRRFSELVELLEALCRAGGMRPDLAKLAARQWLKGEVEDLEREVEDLLSRPSEFSPSPAKFLLTEERVLETPEVSYLVPELIPTRSLAVMYGPPKSGKSFIALDLALSIQTGLVWAGGKLPSAKKDVVYVCLEGQYGLAERIAAWKASRGLQRPLDARYVLRNLFHERPLREAVGALLVDFESAGLRPGLVVIDTLSRSFVGDENDQQCMNLYVESVKAFQELGATVLVVHHARKGAQEVRGSSVLPGAADVVISVALKDGVITLSVEQAKDFIAPDPIPLRLVETSAREGRSSCVVVERVGGGGGKILDRCRLWQDYSLAQLMDLGELKSERSSRRIMDDLTRRGFFEKTDRGTWRRIPYVRPEAR